MKARWLDVQVMGAKGDGRADDTEALQRAIAAVPEGGTLFFPRGRYRVSRALTVSKPMTIRGAGSGSQLYQVSASTDLLVLSWADGQTAQNIQVRDLMLGSAAKAAPYSVIRLFDSHRNYFDNLTLSGGYYGVYLHGSILNTFVNLKSISNLGGFFGGNAAPTFWVYLDGDPEHALGSNFNSFYSPILEGGVYGVYFDGGAFSSGGIAIFGGTIEGQSSYALTLASATANAVVSGTDIEVSGGVDVRGSANITFEGIAVRDHDFRIIDSTNIVISGSQLDSATINSRARHVLLLNTTYDQSNTGSAIVDNAPDTIKLNVYDAFAADGGPQASVFGGGVNVKGSLTALGDADRLNGGATWSVLADASSRDVLGPYTAGLDQIMKLRPVRYSSKGCCGKEETGFLAEELQRVIPQAVEERGAHRFVSADPVLWAMLNAIKEQQKEIKELGSKIDKSRH